VRGSRESKNVKEAIEQGNRQACEQVICRNYRPIYRFLMYLTGDAGFAEELTQETFVSAWSKISQYDGRASLGTWLHRIAYHKFIDSKRRQQRAVYLIDKLKEQSSDIRKSQDPLERILSDEKNRALYEAMRRLQTTEYVVVLLHYVQNLSFRQMSKVLDEPVGTVKWRTSQSLKKLKMLLKGRI